MCSQTVSRWIGRLPKTNQDFDKELQGEHVCWYYDLLLLCVSIISSQTMYVPKYLPVFFVAFYSHI